MLFDARCSFGISLIYSVMQTVHIICQSFLWKDFFVLLTDNFTITELLNCAYGVDSRSRFRQTCANWFPYLPIISRRNQASSCASRIFFIASGLNSLIYFLRRPKGPCNTIESIRFLNTRFKFWWRRLRSTTSCEKVG